MDIRLLIFLWIANCVALSVAHENFLRGVRGAFEHGRKISGWNSRASWIRQVKGGKRSPSMRELEKWWSSKHKGPSHWKPETDFWMSSPQSESAANGFRPIFPTKGWRTPKQLKPLVSVPRLKFPQVKFVKPLIALRRPTKSWTPRKMKQFLPQLKHMAPKTPRPMWAPTEKHHNKDYVPLMKMKDLVPKSAESWPPINNCWPPTSPTSFAGCDPFNNDLSQGQAHNSLGQQESEKPIASAFFSSFNVPANNEINIEDTETKSWDNENPQLSENWSSVSSDSDPGHKTNSNPDPSPSPTPLNDAENPVSKQIWPSFNFEHPWTPTTNRWTNVQNNDGAPLTKDWAPVSAAVSPGISHVGAQSFLGWRPTDKGWARPPPSYDTWTPVTNNEWAPVAEWTPPQNVWVPPSYSWIPPSSDWAPMTQDWPSVVDPTPLHHESNFENEPISITSTENPILEQPVTNSIPYWSPPSAHQWSKMTTNWANEIKGLINQVTHGIF